tara:strand:+ start:583 stop:1107 length:525 start_codon:yes stop_codon:yes gene_type:complete
MATYDMTAKSTTGVDSNSIAALPDARNMAYLVEGNLDIAKLVSAGTFSTVTNGDIFQVLEIPAGTVVIAAGAEVLTAFDGTSPTVDIDFAAGDDIVDGGDVTSTGYLASGTNGGANEPTATTYTHFQSSTDTIDVKVIASSSDVAAGKIRVYAVCCDLNGVSDTADEVDRDQLA